MKDPLLKRIKAAKRARKRMIREECRKALRKRSNFYPNADEDGMVDVDDYPYTK